MDQDEIRAAIEAHEKLMASQADEPRLADEAAEPDAFDLADRYPDVPVGRLTKAEAEHARRGEMGSLGYVP
jgi:hypothetical protein